MLTNLEPHDVLFIDEIHRLSPVVEEVLYPAMEDYQLDIMIGEGPAARSIARSAAVHAGGRYHPRRLADLAAARSLRHCPAAGVLSGGGFAAHRLAQRRVLGLELSDEGPMKWRAGRGDATYCQPSVAPGARLRRSARQRGDQRFGGGAGARYAQRRCRRLRLYGSQTAAGDYRQVYRRPGRAGQRRRRSAKSAKPSRT